MVSRAREMIITDHKHVILINSVSMNVYIDDKKDVTPVRMAREVKTAVILEITRYCY
ncbi:MAG: hypothetical protein ACFFD4_18685 [Candidatus Odinarchaeota archaeon]